VVTWYEFALFVHILAAIVWVGGGALTQVLAFRIVRADDPVRLAGFAKDMERVGMFVFTPAALIVLGFGFALMAEGSWSYDFWVIFGLAVIGASALTGSLFLGPEAGRIGKLVDARGPEYPEVQDRIRRILVISRIELTLLIAVVFAMVVKPFT
jgi:uncharacterized membrane protein